MFYTINLLSFRDNAIKQKEAGRNWHDISLEYNLLFKLSNQKKDAKIKMLIYDEQEKDFVIVRINDKLSAIPMEYPGPFQRLILKHVAGVEVLGIEKRRGWAYRSQNEIEADATINQGIPDVDPDFLTILAQRAKDKL